MTDEAQPDASEASETTQFSYSIDNFNILLEPTTKTEIVEQRDVYPIPHAPEWCRGMISLRGKLIPVIHIHRLLACPEPDSSRWLLIIEYPPLPEVAIPLNQLPVTQKFHAAQFKPVDQEDALPFWLKQVATVADKTLYQADHQQLFQLLALQSQTSDSVRAQPLDIPQNTDASGTEA